jgi:hypothetical protein
LNNAPLSIGILILSSAADDGWLIDSCDSEGGIKCNDKNVTYAKMV